MGGPNCVLGSVMERCPTTTASWTANPVPSSEKDYIFFSGFFHCFTRQREWCSCVAQVCLLGW